MYTEGELEGELYVIETRTDCLGGTYCAPITIGMYATIGGGLLALEVECRNRSCWIRRISDGATMLSEGDWVPQSGRFAAARTATRLRDIIRKLVLKSEKGEPLGRKFLEEIEGEIGLFQGHSEA